MGQGGGGVIRLKYNNERKVGLPQALKTSKEVLKSPSHIMPVLLLQFSLNWLTNPDQNEIKKSGMTSGIEILQT